MKDKLLIGGLVIVVILFVLTQFGQAASCTSCKDVKIKSVSISDSCNSVPCKIGFTAKVSGPVKKVTFSIVDSKTKKVVCSSFSSCGKCTKNGVCSCSCYVKKAGTYDVVIKAYGKDGCCTTVVKKAAITIGAKKLVTSESCNKTACKACIDKNCNSCVSGSCKPCISEKCKSACKSC